MHLRYGENSKQNIDSWLNKYSLINFNPKRILIIMPGNIPLVGLHDLISVIITGNNPVVKLSSKDSILIPFIVSLDSYINKNTSFISGKIKEEKFHAVIATGVITLLNFNYYFSNYPSIIRNNRTSAAIISGDETKKDLDNLASDFLLYFGLAGIFQKYLSLMDMIYLKY